MRADARFVVVVEFDFPTDDSFLDYDSWTRLVAADAQDRLGDEVRVVRSHDHLKVSVQTAGDYLVGTIDMLVRAVMGHAPEDITVRIHEMPGEMLIAPAVLTRGTERQP